MALGIPQYRLRAIESGLLQEVRVDLSYRYFHFLGIDAWVADWCRANRELATRIGLLDGAATRPRDGATEIRRDHALSMQVAKEHTKRPATLLHGRWSECLPSQARLAQKISQKGRRDVGDGHVRALQIRLKDAQIVGVEPACLLSKPALVLEVIEEARGDSGKRYRSPCRVADKPWNDQSQ